MITELQIFTDFSWQKKVDYIVSFYQGIIKKTKNPDYIAEFQAKINEVQWYQENENTTSAMIDLYSHIMAAKEKTKQRKIQKTNDTIQKAKEKLAKIQVDTDDEDPDGFLAESMAKI
jgi:hypothetical protein